MKRAMIALTSLVAMTYTGIAGAVQPTGYLDTAGCDVVGGWAQDPDIPDSAIDVHIYFTGPAGSGAPAVGTRANVHREDLCTAIGSCAHGYYVQSPFSLHDGQPHDVYAYGIDNAGEGNPALGNSPRVLQCAPAAQSGIRRKIDGVVAFESWRFSSFWDLLPLSPDQASQLADGRNIPAKPELVQADDGTPDIYLNDLGVRRPISAADAATWRLDLGKVNVLPSSQIAEMPLGTPLRSRPVVFIAGGLYLVDDPQPYPPEEMPPSSSSSSSSGGWGEPEPEPNDTAEASGCHYTAYGHGKQSWFYATLLATMVAGLRRRASRRN